MLRHQQFTEVDGIWTGYFEAGQGGAVLLVHGGGFTSLPRAAHSAQDWDLNFDGLARWFHVFALDKLGHGYTGNPRTLEDYTREAQIQHAHQFLVTMGLRGVTVVGHSQGGILAARLALEHPELVRACVIVDSGSLAPGLTRSFGEAPRPHLGRESQRWVLQKYSFGWDHITDELLDAMCAIAEQPKYQEALAVCMKVEQVAARLRVELVAQRDETLRWIEEGRLKVPTLLLWGYNDPTAALARGLALFDLVATSARRAQMHIFDKAGHFSFREHPEDFNQVVRSFVQGC